MDRIKAIYLLVYVKMIRNSCNLKLNKIYCLHIEQTTFTILILSAKKCSIPLINKTENLCVKKIFFFFEQTEKLIFLNEKKFSFECKLKKN